MKIYFALSVALIIGIMGCGDNKTVDKLIGTDRYTEDLTPSGSSSSPLTVTAVTAAQSANQSVSCGKISGPLSMYFAPGVIYRVAPPSITDTDSDGYYEYNDTFSNSEVELKFFNVSDAEIAPGPGINKVQVRLTSNYSSGTFAGNFMVSWADPKVLQSGTISVTSSDGTSFTATLANMTFEDQTVSGLTIGLPISGTMAITSANFTGAMTFSKSGSNYLCQGSISQGGSDVATVSLTLDSTFANFTGSYTDLSTGQVYPITY